jgi:hypothetical protein
MVTLNPSPRKLVRELDVSNLDQGLEQALTQECKPGEADSWWWLASLVLMAIGLYLLLSVHLLYDVIHAPAWSGQPGSRCRSRSSSALALLLDGKPAWASNSKCGPSLLCF